MQARINVCSWCDAENSPECRFCSSCHRLIEHNEDRVPGEQMQVMEPLQEAIAHSPHIGEKLQDKHKTSRRSFFLFAGTSLAILLVGAGIFASASGEKRAENAVSAAQAPATLPQQN